MFKNDGPFEHFSERSFYLLTNDRKGGELFNRIVLTR